MKKNGRVSVALHCLIHLTAVDRPVTSEELGLCQQTNPVTIRKILGELKKANIVSSEKGHGGGWVIIGEPKDISFQDVFSALNESLLPPPMDIEKDEHCLIMCSIAGAMEEFLTEADALLIRKLEKMNLQQILDKIPHSENSLSLAN